jgi:AcrR family transcriptional regulator
VAAVERDPRVERTRSLVLGATRDLLSEVGVDRTCIELVAERSGVARSTIYRHWDNKPELVMDALAHLKSEEPEAEPTGEPEADLRAMVRELGGVLRRPESNIMADLIAAAGRDAELAEVHRSFIQRKRTASIRLIRRLQDDGRIDPTLDAEYVAELAVGPVFHRRFNLGDAYTADEVERHLDELLRRLAPA